jgi:hypothetical protein
MKMALKTLNVYYGSYQKNILSKFYFALISYEAGKEKEYGWVSITPARGPLFGPNVFPIFYQIFLLQYKHIG